MFVDTCSLGCNSGVGGLQVNCSVVQVSLTTEVSVLFSESVDPASVNSTSFQLIEIPGGDEPVGTRFVDANNPRRLVFRPSIIFQADGTATFGFLPLKTYRISIPGTAHGDTGDLIRSTGGKANLSRMDCDIQTTDQVDDLVPGSPTVQITVSLRDPNPPNAILHDQPASGAVNVWTNSTITFSFDDIMNPATLANPTTQQSSLITVKVDTDGNLGTVTDQITLFGSYVVTIDLSLLHTTMVFTPSNGLPSAGALPTQLAPRKVVILAPSGVQDLAGNLLSNPGTTIFTPELIHYDPVAIPDSDGEGFANVTNKDAANSGAEWGGGKLSIGWGGGSGRLGALRVASLETVVLDTDGTIFRHLSAPELDPLPPMPIVVTSGFLDNARPTGAPAGYDPLDPLTWSTVTVTNGVFEFSSVVVESNGTLQIVGSKPGKLYSRGPATIDGTIEIAGATPLPHLSDAEDGGAGGQGGVYASSGGDGGDRHDNFGNDDLLFLPFPFNAIENPGAVTDGSPGGGLAGASGGGGRHFPNLFPLGAENVPAIRRGLRYARILLDAQNGECRGRQVASPGGGGAFAVDGGPGVPMTPDPEAENPNPPPPTVPNLPNTTAAGGDSAVMGLEPPDPPSGHFKRKLESVNLVGGSGGGGGGTHLYNTWEAFINAIDTSCYIPDFDIGFITHYEDHSACGGGGGGGAIQVVSGETMRLNGSIGANGGDGGSNGTVLDFERSSRASPGGGGSGGSVRLQAKNLLIDSNGLDRVNVSGGLGGVNLSPAVSGPPIMLGIGGAGGGGLMRFEDISGGTTPPATLMTRCSEAPKLLPFDPLPNPNTTTGPCVGQPESQDHLSVGAWAKPLRRPDSYSGAVSCWYRAEGNFFTLEFAPDNLSVPTSPVYGWNMKVLYGSGTPTAINYRGPDPNSPFGSGDFETNLGSQVNYVNDANPPGNQHGTGPFDSAPGGAYLSVRFQGAVAIADISSNPCNVQLSGLGSKIAEGSLTPWVRHPAELNEFFPRPNMLRYSIVFDRAAAPPGSPAVLIQGITNLIIHAQPD